MHYRSSATAAETDRSVSHPVSRLVVIVALVFSAVYFFVAIPRVVYPYDIDFVEDGLLMQALRVANGQPVFVAPNVEFAPHVYMPLYTWLGGWLLKATGPGFLPLRLLSLSATLAVSLAIYAIAWRESGRRWVAIACAGLWLGGYRISGGWYELARVDALFVALALAGCALAIYGARSRRGLAASGALLGLALLTKQNAIASILVAGVYLPIVAGRRAWIALLACAAVAGAPIALLHWSSGGWFSTYVFGIAYASPVDLSRLLDVARFELFGAAGALAVGLLALWVRVAARAVAGPGSPALARLRRSGSRRQRAGSRLGRRRQQQLDDRLRRPVPGSCAVVGRSLFETMG